MRDEIPPAETSPPRKKKKSETRQRTKMTTHRWLIDEFNEASANAQAAGLSLTAYIRSSTTGKPGQRSQRIPSIDAVLIGKVDGLHGRYGSNMNQIAYQLHAHGELATEAEFRQALDEWAEIRDTHLQALGKLPPGRGLLSWNNLMTEVDSFLKTHQDEETVRVPADLLRRIINNSPNITA